MFYEYNSFSLKTLQKKLGELLTANNKNIFVPNWIVVQNKEMGEWLSVNIAKQNGISAHNEYIFPLELAWKIYRLKDDAVAHHLPLDLIPMQWSIYELLLNKPDLLGETVLKSEKPGKNQLFQIAQNLADIFDLYQVYRPDLLRKFEQNENLTGDETWQADIWNLLVENASADGVKSKMEAFDKLTQWLADGLYPTEKLPQNIYVFSVTQITQPLSQLLAHLSKYVNVHLFHNCVQNHKNEDIKKEWDEFSSQLIQPEVGYNILINRLKADGSLKINELNLDEKAKPNQHKNLLNSVKNALNGVNFELLQVDRSLHIHNCHSIKREAGELKNAILEAMEQDESLKVEDIMVLVPDMNAYKSILEETFNNNDVDPNLPISTGYAALNPAGLAFDMVINQLNGSFKATDLLKIIENPAVSHTLAFDDDDISTIRKWLIDLHIKRGKDIDVYSWRHGLTNLMLGYAMELEEFEDYESYIPYNKVFSSDDILLLAKLNAFIGNLINYSENIDNNRSPLGWLDFLSQLITQLLLPETDDKYGFKRIIRKLEILKEKVALSSYTKEVSYAFIIGWISKQVNEQKATSGRIGGGITVSTYVPNRGIPHKYIAILGFNENVFPRIERRPEYDLIHKNPLPGDRVLKEDDSYLFYQTVQSAEKYLHISYLGQDLYTKNLKLPSILLQQLSDILKREGLEEKQFTTIHKMHAFNKVYFRDENISFSKLNAELSDRIYNKKTEPKSFINQQVELESTQKIDLDALIAYYKDPAKYIAQNILGISLYDDYEELDDREPFDLNPLERYKVRDAIKKATIRQIDSHQQLANMQLTGELPQKVVGKIEWVNQDKLISELKTLIQNYFAKTSSHLDVNLDVSEYSIYGRINDIYEDEYVFLSAASLKAKYLIEVWIKHLILSITKPGFNNSAVICYNKKKKYDYIFFTPIEDAKEQLEGLIKQYIEGCKNPIKNAYEPEMAYAFYGKIIKKPDAIEDAYKEALKKWEGSSFSGKTPVKDDPYNSLIWQSNPADEENFQKVSKVVFKKLIMAKRTAK